MTRFERRPSGVRSLYEIGSKMEVLPVVLISIWPFLPFKALTSCSVWPHSVHLKDLFGVSGDRTRGSSNDKCPLTVDCKTILRLATEGLKKKREMGIRWTKWSYMGKFPVITYLNLFKIAVASVTRFGEISSLWQNIQVFDPFLVWFIQYFTNVVLTLAMFMQLGKFAL